MRVNGTAVAISAVALLVGYGVFTMVWPSDESGAPEAEAVTRAESKKVRARGASDLEKAGHGKKNVPHMSQFIRPGDYSYDTPELEATTYQRDPGEPTAEEAREIFDEAMAELDLAIEGDVVLTAEEERALYSRLTGSFEVLSNHASKNNNLQLDFLEKSYVEMTRKLREAEFDPPRPGAGERPAKPLDRHRRHKRRKG